MLAIERRNEILSRLQTDKKVIVSELSTLYNVSEETIRRDLEKLEKDGYAIKSYGGAVLREDLGTDFPFRVRKTQNTAAKQVIAQLAAPLIHSGDRVFLDASSTVGAVVRQIKELENLTVITNSLEILADLAEGPGTGWNIICTGGVMMEKYLAFLGTPTEQAIRSYYTDAVLLSCKAMSLEAGLMESHPSFSWVKREMIAHSRRRILVVDSSKFGRMSFSATCPLDRITTVVTERMPSEAWLEYFEEKGIECLYPEK